MTDAEEDALWARATEAGWKAVGNGWKHPRRGWTIEYEGGFQLVETWYLRLGHKTRGYPTEADALAVAIRLTLRDERAAREAFAPGECQRAQALPHPDVCAGRWLAGSQPITPDDECSA